MTLKPEDLKPCPFCASPGRTTYMGLAANRWAVGCSSPGCFVLTCDFESEPDAIAAWNRRPDPRPSPVGREEVARIIDPVAFKSWENMRAHCLAKGDDEQEASATADWGHKSAMDAARAKADAILALMAPADGWRPIETAPKDGTLILACQRPDEGRVWFKAWEQWKGPQTIAWRGYHVNAPGKETWRDAKGSPVLPDLWMPLDALAVQGDAHD